MTEATACLCHRHVAHLVRLRSGLELAECRGCGLYARRHRPDAETLVSHYKQDYWAQYAAEQTTEARSNLFRHVLAKLHEHRAGTGHLLDIGCGPGSLLAQARQEGWTATGIEPSEKAAQIGRHLGLDIRVGEWPALSWPTESADAVVLLNVLDHLHDPVAALQAAWRTLRPSGVLYVRVPNGPFHVALLSGRWPSAVARLSVFHLYGFGATALRQLLTQVGFAQVEIRSAPLSQQDAYEQAEPGAQRWVRRAARSLMLFGYRAATVIGLDRLAWGPSLEATAVKR